MLAPDGILAVETPNVTAPLCHPQSRFHPAHVVHFSLETLRYAAEKAGLRALEMHASADGGVLWAVFRHSDGAGGEPQKPAVAPLLEAEAARSKSGYYLNPRVWARTARRLCRGNVRSSYLGKVESSS